MFVDFHLHSLASDGSHSPDAVIRIANENGIQVLSLSDHDTSLGLSEAQSTAQELGLTFIGGIEFTSYMSKQKYEHILGYGIKDYSQINDFLDNLRSERISLIQYHISNLKEQGINIDLETLDSLTPGRHLTVMHIAKFLGKHHSYHLEDSYHFYNEIIPLIKNSGGIAILAHPFRYNSDFYSHPDQLDVYVKNLLDYGLNGIETYYGTHDNRQISICESICHKYGLLQTGGSDWHGWEDRVPMGVTISRRDVERFLEMV